MSRRGRVATVLVVVLVAALIVVGVSDPFAASPNSHGFTDNAYPTGRATVTERTLSSQTEVSATLGYAGSFTVAFPSGTSAATITQARTAAQMAQSQVTSARSALAQAAAAAAPTNAATVDAAHATISNDSAALATARTQLASDENLGCPASSPTTVTSPVGSNSSSGASANLRHASISTTSAPASTPGAQDAGAPQATTGPADATSATSTRLTGTVNPNGAVTTYYFEYGTSPNYGSATPSDGRRGGHQRRGDHGDTRRSLAG